jgi:ZIP family zinc transporter
MKKGANPRLHRAMLGFAAGVMIAASVWSLLIPSIEESGSWIPAVTGFIVGTAGMMLLDYLVPDFDMTKTEPSKLGESAMLFIAVTVHNVPEGMAVGVAFSGALSGMITPSEAFTLSIGIAVQNFPEGTIISAPLASDGMPKKRAFLYGLISGAVEPAAAAITVLLTWLVAPILPFLLSFAAGAMIYVVVEDLIPEAKSHIGTASTAIGFALMMLLDVAMG